MTINSQLIQENKIQGGYSNIFPKTFIDALSDKESGATLTDILAMFNMLFLSYNGSRSQTRLQVPPNRRRKGLWITYVLYDGTVVTEWYNAEAIDDTSWEANSNWRIGNNSPVGDVSISSDGYMVINGEATNIKSQGEAGITSNKLYGKRISILGDSISTFGVPDQSNAEGLWTYTGNRCSYPQSDLLMEVNDCYWKILIDRFNLNIGINESWAGSRVSNNQATDFGDFGPNRCMSSQTRINHLGENGYPDIILIYGGINDAGAKVPLGTFNTENPKNYTSEQIANLPVVTFADAYRAMLIRLLKTYPNSRIIVILPSFTPSYYTIGDLDSYIEIIKEECDYFGVEFIDPRIAGASIFNESSYFPDGIHPNRKGMLALANLISSRFDRFNKYGL